MHSIKSKYGNETWLLQAWHKFKFILIWRPLISIAYSYASEAYFHNFVSLSTKSPFLKVKTIAESGLYNKRWHNQQQFCHYIM